MATGHGAPSDAIWARETHKQRESGQSGSKDDEWEQVNDAKQRCRLVLSSSLATRDPNYSPSANADETPEASGVGVSLHSPIGRNCWIPN